VRRKTAPPNDQTTNTVVLLDVEATGLDQRNDEVIERGIVKFDYCWTADTFTSFNEPSAAIPREVASSGAASFPYDHLG